MPLFTSIQRLSQGRGKQTSQEEERLAYNRRIEKMRKTEYVMLKGIVPFFLGSETNLILRQASLTSTMGERPWRAGHSWTRSVDR